MQARYPAGFTEPILCERNRVSTEVVPFLSGLR